MSRASAEVDLLRRGLELLRVEVEELKETVRSLQERLSSVESRTPQEEFELLPSVSGTTVTEAGYTVGSERQAIAREIGVWIRRALQGLRRGLSGRERISQSSRYYLVFRDFDLAVHDPPLLFTSWAACKVVVIQRGQQGDSLYIGLPTREECRIVCTSASCSLPSALTDGRAGRD